MSCVPVRGCRIGEGRPKVILPIVERTELRSWKRPLRFPHCAPIVWNGGSICLMQPLTPGQWCAAWQSCGSS